MVSVIIIVVLDINNVSFTWRDTGLRISFTFNGIGNFFGLGVVKTGIEVSSNSSVKNLISFWVNDYNAFNEGVLLILIAGIIFQFLHFNDLVFR